MTLGESINIGDRKLAMRFKKDALEKTDAMAHDSLSLLLTKVYLLSLGCAELLPPKPLAPYVVSVVCP